MLPDLSVSVVIPTIGRPQLRRAIFSVLAQTFPAHEIIVVNDRSGELASFEEHPSVTVLSSGGRGGNVARAMGVERASGTLIAFLDDDDWWFPQKLERQISVLPEELPSIWFSSTQVYVHGGRRARVWPADPPNDQDIPSYLLRRRRVAAGGGVLPTSTLLAPRSVFQQVPLDTALKIHQDLDWVLRVVDSGASVYHCHEPLVAYSTEDSNSVSRKAAWRDSLAWAQRNKDLIGAAAYADYCLTVPWQLATSSNSREAYPILLREAWSEGIPSPYAGIYAVSKLALSLMETYRGDR